MAGLSPPPKLGGGERKIAPPPKPGVGERKKAVICGVTDRNTPNEHMGCINDAKCMKYLLINCYSFPEANVIMLT
ncbi:unnamed protein product, partial [Musa hybrid cultivar]